VTLDDSGKIIDRRAQRKETGYYTPLIKKLKSKIRIPGTKIFILQGAEHRFVVVLRKKGLGTAVTDSDPQKLFVEPLIPQGLGAAGKKTAAILVEFIVQAQNLLSDEKIANGFTLRGYSHKPTLPSFKEAYGFHSAGIATHPLYEGIAKLFGMDVLEVDGKQPKDIVDTLIKAWNKYNFYYLHFKWPDSRGEDGDFKGKVKAIEEIDKVIPAIRKLKPDVIAVTGDHSTPAYMAQHSWHPVPTLIWGRNVFRDQTQAFSERECSPQSLNSITYAKDMIMPQVLSASGRLKKYGP
jgi:2,3-bisphosphoglycerate-independent phosphoglycerate mutase